MDLLTYSICPSPLAVVPVLVGPLQAFLAVLPIILGALGSLILTLCKPSTVKKLLQLLWSQKLAVLGMLIVVAGAVYCWPMIFSNRAAVSGPTGPGEWPLWRGTLARTGFVPGIKWMQFPPWIVGYLVIVLPLSLILKPVLRIY